MIRLTPEEFAKKYGKESLLLFPETLEQNKSGYIDRLKSTASQGVQKINESMEESVAGRNPISTGLKAGAGMVEIGYSPITAALQPIIEPTIGKGIEYIADKVSDMPQVQKFATSKTGETTSKIVDDISNATEIISAVAPFTGKGIPKMNVGNLENTLSKKLIETTKTGLNKQPEKIMQRVARINKTKQTNFERIAGESIGKYLVRRGIYGSIDDIITQLYKRFIQSKSTADKALEQIPGTYRFTPVRTALKELFERETSISTTGAPSRDLQIVKQLLNKEGQQGLNMTEINLVKRLYERNIKTDYLKTNIPTGVAKANAIDTAIRDWQRAQAIKNGLKNLPKINKETQLSKRLLDDLGAEYSGQAGNNAMSLTDWIMLSGGDPTAISGFLIKKTFSSKSVQSAIAKALSKGEEVMGDVRADFGISQIKQLPSGKTNLPSVQVKTPMSVVPPTTYEGSAGVINRTATNKTGDIFIRDLKTGKIKYQPKKR